MVSLAVNLPTKAGTIFDHVIKSLTWLACALILLAILAVSVGVVMRYFFNCPIVWVLEICEYILLYIVFLGTAWVLREEGHVKVSFLVDRLSPKTQAMVNVITSILGIAGCLALSIYGTQVTWDYFQRGVPTLEFLKLPKFLVLMIIPIGSSLLTVQFLRRSYGYLRTWRSLPAKSKGV